MDLSASSTQWTRGAIRLGASTPTLPYSNTPLAEFEDSGSTELAEVLSAVAFA